MSTATRNIATGWLQIRFTDKPDEDTLTSLRYEGFRFRHGAWKASWSLARQRLARKLCEAIEDICIEPRGKVTQLRDPIFLGRRIRDTERSMWVHEGTLSRDPDSARAQEALEYWRKRLDFYQGKLDEAGGPMILPDLQLGDGYRYQGKVLTIFRINDRSISLASSSWPGTRELVRKDSIRPDLIVVRSIYDRKKALDFARKQRRDRSRRLRMRTAAFKS